MKTTFNAIELGIKYVNIKRDADCVSPFIRPLTSWNCFAPMITMGQDDFGALFDARLNQTECILSVPIGDKHYEGKFVVIAFYEGDGFDIRGTQPLTEVKEI